LYPSAIAAKPQLCRALFNAREWLYLRSRGSSGIKND
jgi:hypothetical protein